MHTMWIPLFQWEFRGRWGAGSKFSEPDCIPSVVLMARGGVVHVQERKGLPFRKAQFSPCSSLSTEGSRLPVTRGTSGKEGIESHVAIYSPQICLPTGVRWHTVPSPPLDMNCKPTLPSQGCTQGRDAYYQSNITNPILSDKVHRVSIITQQMLCSECHGVHFQ